MYRHCIYCSAELGANEAVEAFPIGRTVAFDGEKGRLWAVCRACGRWNLAPIETRWEAVEEAERIFRGTRTRVRSENVGLARLPDGTRLIRVGAALPGELAAWRYGDQLVERHRRYRVSEAAGSAASVALGAGAIALFGPHGFTVFATTVCGGILLGLALDPRRKHGEPVVHRFRPGELPHCGELALLHGDMGKAYLAPGAEGGFDLVVPSPRSVRVRDEEGRERWVWHDGYRLCGEDARGALGRALARINVLGGVRRTVSGALALVEDAGAAETFLRRAAERELRLQGAATPPAQRLALEMALHDEQERRALEGELTLLEAAWRQAEEIADLADRLAAPPIGPGAKPS